RAPHARRLGRQRPAGRSRVDRREAAVSVTVSLSEPLRTALAELARVPMLLVALDFDGTLAPEVDVPDDARAIPAARDAVLRLNELDATRVALVSGRAMASLIHVSRLPDDVLLIGSHGIEQRLDHPDDR